MGFNSFQFLSDFPYPWIFQRFRTRCWKGEWWPEQWPIPQCFWEIRYKSIWRMLQCCWDLSKEKCAWVRKAEASSFITFCIHSQSGPGRRICFIDSLHDFRKVLIKDMQSWLHMCMPKIRLRDARWRLQSDEWTCNSHLRMVKGIEGELLSSELLESGTVTGQQGHLICRTTLIMLQVVEVKAEWNVELAGRSNACLGE